MQVLENERFRVEISEHGRGADQLPEQGDRHRIRLAGRPGGVEAPRAHSVPDRRAAQGQDLYRGRQGVRDYPARLRPRSAEWQASRESDTCVSFTLTPNEYTKKMYPWDFVCTVRYTLDGASLKKEHITQNRSDTPMYYEIGGHDAYNLCWQEGERITDYFVAFEGTDRLHRIVTDEAVMLTEARTEIALENGRLPISRALFADDAVMTEGLPVHRASIGCTKNSRTVTMDFADFDYFAVWSPYKDFEVPFVCLEPWSTLPDGTYLDHAIEHKQGVRVLQPGQSETLAFTTTIHE